MKISNLFIILGISVVFSTSLVTGLFLASEEAIDRNNAFIRRYPHHPVSKVNQFNLGYNSYYIAGITNDSVYLGNITAPLHLLAIDRELKDTTHHRIFLDQMNQFPFRSVTIIVQNSRYYVVDGSVPVVYTGKIGNWNSKILFQDQAYFTKFQPVLNGFAFLTRDSRSNESELGKFAPTQDFTKVSIIPGLLTRQIDGIFDSDGFLLYNSSLNQIIYAYRYRNEFIVANNNLELLYRGKTIDTITTAHLQIDTIRAKNQRKLGPASIEVTLQAATSNNYLFLSSDRLGKYESPEMAEKASIIDVYNLRDQTYEYSFYLYNYESHKMREFTVKKDQLFFLGGSYLISYKLKT